MAVDSGSYPQSLPWVFVLLLLLHSVAMVTPSSSAHGHGGNTHPALQSGDFASIGLSQSSSDRPPPTDVPAPSREEIPFEPAPVDGAVDPQPSSQNTPNKNEFPRPKRTIVGETRHPSKPNFENVVSNLKNQLRESQAAQVHTRSIINVLQEKVEAQENHLSFMKNEISLLRREHSAQRELIASMKSSASDTSWAIASVKRNQDETSGDVRALKRIQERHNETLLVMEEVIMNNAVELQSQEKHTSAIQQDLFQLRAQVTEDKGKMNKLHRAVAQLEKVRGMEEENMIDENDTSLPNHLSVYNPRPSGSRAAPLQGKKPSIATGLTKDDDGAGVAPAPSSIQTKLEELSAALEQTKGLLGNLSEHVTSVEGQVAIMSEKQLMDTQLLQLQQSFINFTSQIYQLQQWRKTQTEKGQNTEEYMSQYENDMASVIFHLESQTERLRLLEGVVTEYRTMDRESLQSLNQTVIELGSSVSQILVELDQPKLSEKEELVERRLKAVEEDFKQLSGKLKEVEIAVLNASLFQCKAVNEQLMDDVRGANYVKHISDVQMKISEQTMALARLDRGLAGIFQELDKNAGTSSGLAEEMDELKKLSPEVATMQRELLNFVLQLPTDCYDVPDSTGNALHDTVYLIRPETSRQSARTFCRVEDDVIWTLIQRRTDGRESFARSWADYRSGFGDAASEFWLGNENIHRLTDGARLYRLRIDLWDVLGRYWVADYSVFRVHAEDALYRIELGDFRGNATDALRYSNLMPFSALDRDNDVSTTHCAEFYQSGWWYKHCHYSNLNGRYTSGIVWFHQDLNEWIQMKRTTMRISMVTGIDHVTTRPSG